MISVLNKVAEAAYGLLNGVISVEVYRTNAPKDEKENHVIIIKVSEREIPIASVNWTECIIRFETVTYHENSAEDETSGNIGNEITKLINPNLKGSLPEQSGIQISNVYIQSRHFLDEYDGVRYIHREFIDYRIDITQR